MKRFVQSVLEKFGYRLVRLETLLEKAPENRVNSPLECFFLALHNLGFQPKHIVDVGANHGSWTRSALVFFPECAFTLIEPQSHLKSHIADLLLTNSNLEWITAGVGDRHATLKFTVCDRNDSSNFRFSSEEATAQGYQQIEVEVFTLNEIVSNSKFPFPDMVKIDTEGFDLKVIAGASNLIGKTEIFLLESAICAKGIENTLAKNVMIMDRLGYVPFDITDLNRSPKDGVMWLCEMAFIQRNSPLLAKLISYE